VHLSRGGVSCRSELPWAAGEPARAPAQSGATRRSVRRS